jgi:hypothetical protein
LRGLQAIGLKGEKAMMSWYELEARRMHNERIHEADQERMLRQAGVGRRSSARLRGRAMIWLGHRLVESGKRLELEQR